MMTAVGTSEQTPEHSPHPPAATRHGAGWLASAGTMAAALLLASGCALTPARDAAPRAAWVLPRAASPEAVGLSSAQLDKLAAVTRGHVDSGVLPGAVIVIARRGRIAYLESFGARDRTTNAAMAEDAIFRLYSMTKPIVSVALMMLVEEGRLQVDDPVSRYLPEIGRMQVGVERKDASGAGTLELVAPARPMTVQDLLRHTSGLTYASRARGPVADQIRAAQLGNRNESNQTFVDKLARTPLMFSPGNRWEYGVSTDVLGRLVEVISGKSLGEFLEERIFKPLGMLDTAFHVSDDKAWRFAGCYLMNPEGKLAPVPGRSFREPAVTPSGGGGLVSTASDYMRFCEAMRRGGVLGDVRLLGPKTVALMRSNHLPGGRDLSDISISMFSEAIYQGVGFGLGFAMTTNVAKTQIAGSMGEFWWGGAASTAFWIDPVEDISVVFLTQFMPSNLYPIRRELRTLVNASVLDSKA